jgi:hypothetical protein
MLLRLDKLADQKLPVRTCDLLSCKPCRLPLTNQTVEVTRVLQQQDTAALLSRAAAPGDLLIPAVQSSSAVSVLLQQPSYQVRSRCLPALGAHHYPTN